MKDSFLCYFSAACVYDAVLCLYPREPTTLCRLLINLSKSTGSNNTGYNTDARDKKNFWILFGTLSTGATLIGYITWCAVSAGSFLLNLCIVLSASPNSPPLWPLPPHAFISLLACVTQLKVELFLCPVHIWCLLSQPSS